MTWELSMTPGLMFCGLKPYYNLSFLSLITQCPLYQKNAKSDFNEIIFWHFLVWPNQQCMMVEQETSQSKITHFISNFHFSYRLKAFLQSF